MTLLSQIAGFALTLAALTALSRWISRQVQVVGWRLTGHEQAALIIYFLLFLPGILLHELSHALMARVLGLKVPKFSLGPRIGRQYVQLGAVQVTSGGVIRDSLVGVAPFLGGTAVLLLISYRIFNVGVLGDAWTAAGWSGVLQATPYVWQVPDSWLWAYLIFTVSNSMMPSPADRQPWLAAAVYLLLALIGTYLVGVLGPLTEVVGPEVTGALPVLTIAFLFSLALDVAAATLLWAVDLILMAFIGSPT